MTHEERAKERAANDEFIMMFVRRAMLWVIFSAPFAAVGLWASDGDPSSTSIILMSLVAGGAVAGRFGNY